LTRYAAEHQERWHLYKKPLFPGCALVAVLVDAHGKKLYTANTGDCAAMLYFGPSEPLGALTVGFPQDGVSDANLGLPAAPPLGMTLLSRAHKPADAGELARVCATERGFVEVHGQRVTPDNAAAVAALVAEAQAAGRKALYRINRDVSLSRAIGDWDLKEFGVIATPDVSCRTHYILLLPIVPNIPLYERHFPCARGVRSTYLQSTRSQVTVYAFDPEEVGSAALVLATDGVWDVLESDDVFALLSSHGGLVGGASSSDERTAAAERAAAELVAAAHGVVKNNDDVTAIVACLDLSARRVAAPGVVVEAVEGTEVDGAMQDGEEGGVPEVSAEGEAASGKPEVPAPAAPTMSSFVKAVVAP